MAIAAAPTPSFVTVNHISRSHSHSHSSHISFNFVRVSPSIPKSNILNSNIISSVRNKPNFRVVSAMSVEAPHKDSPTSFLDHKESGILNFVNYHGLGNDFILVDNRDTMEPKITPEQAVKFCDRNLGVGADGVIFVMLGINGTDYTMRIFNSDGSEPEMCGNGVRWFARFIAQLENLHGKQRSELIWLKASDVPTK